MRKVIGLAVLSSVFAVWACSSSSPTPVTTNNNGDDSGSTSSSGGGDDSGSGSSDAGQSCSTAQISAMASALGFDGGLDGGTTGACIQSMCATEIDACQHESCSACQTPIISCATTKCITFDASIPIADASGSCDAPGPTCAALSACCTQISTVAGFLMNATLTSYATQCTTNSKSCDESACASTITSVNQLGAGFNMPMLCKGPDAGP